MMRTLSLIGLALLLSGCAVSRHQELKRMSGRVAKTLRNEQSLALDAEYANALDRESRLDHLTALRTTLSAANIGLASVPRVVPEPQRPLAYDVLEEVYTTIDWNIPLGPGDTLRSLPDAFSGGVLDVSRLADPTRTPGILPTAP